MESMFVTLAVLNFERSMVARDEQPENMLCILITASVFRVVGNTMISKDEQPENMSVILVAREVSKPDRSKALRDEQPLNIDRMLSTIPVSKLFGKEREVSEEQSRNISSMPVTCEVSNLDRLRDPRDEQSENIP